MPIGDGQRSNADGWMLTAAAALAWFALHSARLSHDIAWQGWLARQMLGGTRLYGEILEVNPPLWFWMAIPEQWLARLTETPWQSWHFAFILILGATSAWATGRLIPLNHGPVRLGFILALFWLITIVPLADIGQREQIALMGAIPYAALIARRRSERDTAATWAIAAGLLGALGFALKHYFLIVPVVLELWLALDARRRWKPFRSETGILALGAIAYGAAVLVSAPEYMTKILPMVNFAYDDFDSSARFVLVSASTLCWTAMLGYLFVFRAERQEPSFATLRECFQALVLVAAGFAVAYLIQWKGWYYQTIGVTGALSAAMMIHLIAAEKRSPVSPIMGVTILLLPFATLITPRPGTLSVAKESAGLLDNFEPGQTVFAASTYPRLVWPEIETRGLRWPWRGYFLWMVPAIMRHEASGDAADEAGKLASEILRSLVEDLECNPPDGIILQKQSIAQSKSMQDLLFRDPQLKMLIERNYQPIGESDRAIILGRVMPIARKGPNCRTIY